MSYHAHYETELDLPPKGGLDAPEIEEPADQAQQPAQAEPVPPIPEEPDFWRISGDYLIRYHNTPRKTLYVPGENFPIPLAYIDNTNLDGRHQEIDD